MSFAVCFGIMFDQTNTVSTLNTSNFVKKLYQSSLIPRMSGLATSVLPMSGLPMSGLATSGLATNSLPMSGLPMSGLAMSGLLTSGLDTRLVSVSLRVRQYHCNCDIS